MSAREAIDDFLERYGAALSSSDVEGITRCWEVPALVLSDQGAIAVTAEDEIRHFFSSAAEWYHEQGLLATHPVNVQVADLSERLLAVDVEWSATDAEGNERSREHSHYVVRVDDAGQPRIRVAISRPLPAPG